MRDFSQAELKVKESHSTILMLGSNSSWENNIQLSPLGVSATLQQAGLGVSVQPILYWVDVTQMGLDL